MLLQWVNPSERLYISEKTWVGLLGMMLVKESFEETVPKGMGGSREEGNNFLEATFISGNKLVPVG